jgi:hypothetical protein
MVSTGWKGPSIEKASKANEREASQAERDDPVDKPIRFGSAKQLVATHDCVCFFGGERAISSFSATNHGIAGGRSIPTRNA